MRQPTVFICAYLVKFVLFNYNFFFRFQRWEEEEDEDEKSESKKKKELFYVCVFFSRVKDEKRKSDMMKKEYFNVSLKNEKKNKNPHYSPDPAKRDSLKGR